MGRGPLARHWESVSVLSAVLANPPGFDRQATQNARGSAADEPSGAGCRPRTSRGWRTCRPLNGTL